MLIIFCRSHNWTKHYLPLNKVMTKICNGQTDIRSNLFLALFFPENFWEWLLPPLFIPISLSWLFFWSGAPLWLFLEAKLLYNSLCHSLTDWLTHWLTHFVTILLKTIERKFRKVVWRSESVSEWVSQSVSEWVSEWQSEL